MEAADLPHAHKEVPVAPAQTLADVLTDKRMLGFEGRFSVGSGPTIRCLSCGAKLRADDVELLDAGRLEGTSDPADEILVACLRCPRCKVLGTAVLTYGPLAPPEHSEALALFKDSRSES